MSKQPIMHISFVDEVTTEMESEEPIAFLHALEQEYLNWKKSLKILNRIHGGWPGEPPARGTVKAGLENALMRILLDRQVAGRDLFLKLTPEILLYGYGCVGIKPVPSSELDRQIGIIHEEWERKVAPHYSDLNTRVSATAFSIGEFSLPRNSYIDKAYSVVAEQSDPATGALQILKSALRYASIYSETRHIGPPQSVYDAFYNWGVRHEGFASPFNARVIGKEKASFYSLFADTDGPFGSRGSFFKLEEPDRPGHWCLDPPFLPETMDRVDAIIADWRNRFPDRSILLIIPEWHQPAHTPDETVLLSKGIHHYEGLKGTMHPLPVNVCVHRYGEMPGFSGKIIQKGYLPN